jgi:hypothetical protein
LQPSDDTVLAKGEYLLSLGQRESGPLLDSWMRVELGWFPDGPEEPGTQIAVWLIPEVTHEHARLVDEVIDKHQELMEFVRGTGGEPLIIGDQ